jgi:hypothetical protein
MINRKREREGTFVMKKRKKSERAFKNRSCKENENLFNAWLKIASGIFIYVIYK